MQHKDIQNAMNEVRFLASIKSPFIVSYKESIYSESAKELYIIMEFMGVNKYFKLKINSLFSLNKLFIFKKGR